MKDYSDAPADSPAIHSHMEYGDGMPEQHPPADAARAEVAAREEGATRNISQLTRQTLAIVLAGGRGERLRALTDWRAKPAVPFGGKFRIIDFTLSNCVNSGIRRIGIATQYKAQSLIRHVQRGWASMDGRMGEFVELPTRCSRTSTSCAAMRRSMCSCWPGTTSTRWTTARCSAITSRVTPT